MEKPQVTKTFLYSIMLGMLCTGTANTIVGKYIDLQIAPKRIFYPGEPDNPYPYDYPVCFPYLHPYIQTAVMFVGELIVFSFLFIKNFLDRKKAQE